MNFEFDYKDLTVKVIGYNPGRQAPVCNNPSSPNFGDPGDDPEFEDFIVCVGDDDITEYLSDKEIDNIVDRIFEEGEEL